MEEMNYSMEEALKLLDDYVKMLESGDTALADSFNTYNKGMKLIEYCNNKLNTMQKEIELIQNSSGKEEGTWN